MVVTSANDWVVEVCHKTQVHKRYVNASAERAAAIYSVLQNLRINPSDIDWIKTKRRHEVEKCISMEDIIGSKIRD